MPKFGQDGQMISAAGSLPRRQRVSAAIYLLPAPTDGCEPGSMAAVAQPVPDSGP
jgi:hypothetical protein